MPFNTVTFWVFFALVAIVFGLTPMRYRWWLLLAASIVFFAWSAPWALIYVLASTLAVYAATQYLGRPAEEMAERKRKAVFTAALLVCFGILGVLKYYNFLAGTIVGSAFEPVRFLIPIGISFYTFQLTSYLIDVYNGTVEVQRNYGKLLLYTVYFPQLIDGPISRYEDISAALFNPPDIEYTRCRNALVLFCFGLFKKVCIADNIILFSDIVFRSPESYHGLVTLAGAVAYAIYIYADFSGCIDMARGISQYFGITLKDNFERPYFSSSVEEFWRRWHITLSVWFRDYLFYPVLRTRAETELAQRLRKSGKKKLSRILPTSLALLVVWFTTGLWHGAKWTFVVYGLYYGVFMIVGNMIRTLRGKKGKKEDTVLLKGLKIAGTFFAVCVGYIFFNSPSLPHAFLMIGHLFDVRHILSLHQASAALHGFISALGGMPYFAITIVSILILLAYDLAVERGADVCALIARRPRAVKYLCAVAAVVFLLFMINRTAGDFTYMQF